MITLEVFEPTKERPYKEIYYRNQQGQTLSHVVLDVFGALIEKSLSEYNQQGLLQTHTIFTKDYITPLAYREYEYLQDEVVGFKDYQNVRLQQLTSTENDATLKNQKENTTNIEFNLIVSANYQLINDERLKCSFSDENNHFFAYELFDVSDGRSCSLGLFDLDGKPFSRSDLPCYMIY